MAKMPPSVCSFRLGSLWLGVDVQRVREVVVAQGRTRLPLAPPAVRGLMNLRGEIVTLIDLRERLGLHHPGADEVTDESVHMVVMADGVSVSLLVDEVGEVMDVGSATVPVPDTLRGRLRDFLVGVRELPDRLLLILDLDATLDVPV